MTKTVLPYGPGRQGKKEQVEQMFNNIAHRYDFLNHFLSLGIDKIWRRRLVKRVAEAHPKEILDVATGTGDVAIALCALKPSRVTGIDISAGMLEKGRAKVQRRGLEKMIRLQQADSEHLPFSDRQFDAVTVAYGVRNFEHLELGLQEIFRVLKPGGLLVVLEFSKPARFPLAQLFRVYFRYILPWVGKLFTHDPRAYTYLPESVQAFPEGPAFEAILRQQGFQETTCKPLSSGITTLYSARR